MAFSFFFFFNDTATTEIYTLSLHDALPIFYVAKSRNHLRIWKAPFQVNGEAQQRDRSEEHTSELQSQSNLVCRLLLEKKKLSGWTPTMYHLSAPPPTVWPICRLPTAVTSSR